MRNSEKIIPALPHFPVYSTQVPHPLSAYPALRDRPSHTPSPSLQHPEACGKIHPYRIVRFIHRQRDLPVTAGIQQSEHFLHHGRSNPYSPPGLMHGNGQRRSCIVDMSVILHDATSDSSHDSPFRFRNQCPVMFRGTEPDIIYL